jgi:vacuolar-type H+-ATPase subunit E/Vma4
MGEEADGLGGFVLDAEDGSVSYDFRFDALLTRAWTDNLPGVSAALFD